MRNEFTALIERDGPWYIAYSPEIPGANGEGKTKAARWWFLGFRRVCGPGSKTWW
jgi:hypothetical protein